eukprot:5562613-Prymnesium_polylepis.1
MDLTIPGPIGCRFDATSDAHPGPPRGLSERASRAILWRDANRSPYVRRQCAKLYGVLSVRLIGVTPMLSSRPNGV